MAGKKKVTLAEFHAWLEGVEEMHEADWHPDVNQWVKIRNKIKTIQEVAAPNVPTPAGPLTTAQQFNPPSLPGGFVPAPEAPSSIPNGPVEKASALADSMLVGDGQGKTITPTSETGDASPFS